MTTVAYCAVTREGTTDGHQIVLDGPDVLPGLRALTDAVHAEGAAVGAQIGHAGPVANPMGTKVPSVAPSRVFSPLGMRRTRALSPEQIARITDQFASGARVLRGGFWLEESLAFARMLEHDGALDALTLTGGSSFENPMYLFRGEAPVAEMAEMFAGPLKLGVKLVGGRFFKEYPFEEAYFLPYA